MSMTAVSSRIARSKSLPSAALLARPIKRFAVSLLEASQIAQMRFSIYFALSSSGATLSAANSRSRFCVLSPRRACGSVLGGSIGLSGSGSTVSAGAGSTQAAANSAATIHARNRWLMRSSLALRSSTIKTRFRQRRAQPWRALKRRWTLLITYTRPLRRTNRLLRWRLRSNFNELRTFMALTLVRAAARFAERLQSRAEIRHAMPARQLVRAGRRPRPSPRAPLRQIIDSALFSSCGVRGAGDRQLQQPGRVGKEDRVALRLGDIEVPDQLDGARFERGQRRGVAAIDDAFGSHPLEHHFHRREIVGDRVEMHLLEVVARRMFDLHRRVRAEEECLLLQLVGIVHPADGLADAAAAVRGHDGHAREILQNPAHDQPPQRQAQIEGPSDAGGETIVLHALLAEAEVRRMDHHRHVEFLHQLPKRARLVVVRIVALVAGMNENALEAELTDRALGLLDEGRPAAGQDGRE